MNEAPVSQTLAHSRGSAGPHYHKSGKFIKSRTAGARHGRTGVAGN